MRRRRQVTGAAQIIILLPLTAIESNFVVPASSISVQAVYAPTLSRQAFLTGTRGRASARGVELLLDLGT